VSGKRFASVTAFYDGACPLCSAYTAYQRLQQTADKVALVDAREMSMSEMKQLSSAGVDINAGMVVCTEEPNGALHFYSGAAAMKFLSAHDDRRGLRGHAHRWFRAQWFTRLAYPVLYQGRRVLLRLLRVPQRIEPGV
jgi:predicted DCC family thiol-disulfide oxidoreductase YuxK